MQPDGLFCTASLAVLFDRTKWHVGSKFPNQVSNPHLLQWKLGVLTTGPPGKSRPGPFYYSTQLQNPGSPGPQEPQTSNTGWGIDLDYCDIEWFALEMNRYSVIFEIASKYCISDSFVDYANRERSMSKLYIVTLLI